MRRTPRLVALTAAGLAVATVASGCSFLGLGSDPGDLQVYTGVYTSAELMTSYSLIVRDGQLIARHFRTGDVLFKAMAADRFRVLLQALGHRD